jgi:hypothetical protein
MTRQTPCSSAFAWDTRTPERFHMLNLCFDVRAAKRAVADSPRGVVPLDVASLRRLSSHIRRLGTAPVNLEIPLVVATTRHGHTVIDGWRRIAAAIREGLDTLPCVILTTFETKLATVYGPT